MSPARAQFFRPLERVPEPTVQDGDPGQDRGSAEAVPYEFRRQPVFYRSQEPAGTVIVDTSERFLFLIQSPTNAMRYGIGVGRDGFIWTGILRISRKAGWPDWTPPPEMIERQPYLPRWMAGGPGNPLGARAMYLGATVYRIHGTNAPETIGHAVSSGWSTPISRIPTSAQRSAPRWSCGTEHDNDGPHPEPDLRTLRHGVRLRQRRTNRWLLVRRRAARDSAASDGCGRLRLPRVLARGHRAADGERLAMRTRS